MRANIVNPTVNKERFHLRLRWHDDSDAIIENSLPPFFENMNSLGVCITHKYSLNN